MEKVNSIKKIKKGNNGRAKRDVDGGEGGGDTAWTHVHVRLVVVDWSGCFCACMCGQLCKSSHIHALNTHTCTFRSIYGFIDAQTDTER